MSSTIRPGPLALAATLLATLPACGGKGGSDSGSGDGSACSANDTVMTGLAPTCAGCHTQGSQPFFVSLASFNALLAYNTTYVVPGHPEQSYLIKLLQGQGTGTYTQMPLAGDPFVKLEAAGNTSISLAQIETWITDLTPMTAVTTPDPTAVTVQRVSAEQIRNTLYAQLGLAQADFYTTGPTIENYGVPEMNTLGEDNYPFAGADDLPGSYTPEPVQRHAELGGSQTLNSKVRDLSPSPPFAEALVSLSQRWCKMGIAKPSSAALLFPYVDSAATSAASADAIKKNLSYLNLHFLGEPADPADIDDVFQNVFVPLEAEADPPTAWAGVCSYFIRHPRWIFY